MAYQTGGKRETQNGYVDKLNSCEVEMKIVWENFYLKIKEKWENGGTFFLLFLICEPKFDYC